jgi:hypothetical protein
LEGGVRTSTLRAVTKVKVAVARIGEVDLTAMSAATISASTRDE